MRVVDGGTEFFKLNAIANCFFLGLCRLAPFAVSFVVEVQPGGQSLASTVVDSFLENAETRGDALFLKLNAASSTRNYTFLEIRDLAYAYNAHFRAARLPRGSVLAIILTHGVDLYGAFLGAMMAGLVPTLMPFPTPKQDKARYWTSHAELFALSKIRAILTYDENLDDARRHFGAALDYLSSISQVDRTRADARLDRHEVALLQHSSGTTALKKGVMLTHDAIHAQVKTYARSIGVTAGSRFVTWLPLYHDMGLVSCFLMPMIIGCPIAHMDPFVWSARPTLLLDELVAFEGEYAWLPNFAYNHIVNCIRPSMQWDLSRVKAIIDCSEPCKAATFERFRAHPKLASLNPQALQVCYAMAENVFAVTQTRLDESPRVIAVDPQSLREGRRIRLAEADAADAQPWLSCGRAIEGVGVRIIDRDGATLDEDGAIGEIAISGPCLYSGYHYRPEITAQRLVDGWHRTGDVGFLLDGELYVTGRVDDLLILRGKNIYAHEVEEAVNALGVAIPGRIVAFSAPNETVGAEDLIILCELSADAPDAKAKKAIRETIDATFGVTVSHIGAVAPGTLVKTTSGKLSRKDNRLMYLGSRHVA